MAMAFTTAFGLATSLVAKPKDEPPAPPLQIVDEGSHHQTFHRVVAHTNKAGQVSFRTNKLVRLETGLQFKNAQGKWQAASDEIELVGGHAEARKGRHRATFQADIADAQGALHVKAADGKKIRTKVLGLAYYDWHKRQSVLVAELQGAIGELGDRFVYYPDAFTDVKMDVRYRNSKAGVEQDVIIQERLPNPELFGFNPNTTWVELWTEFLNAPEPVVTQKIRPRWTKSTVDTLIDFGDLKIGQGTAFNLGQDQHKSIPVNKHWIKDGKRRCLIEEVSWNSLVALMRDLPERAQAKVEPRPGSKVNCVAASRQWTDIQVAKSRENKPMRLASSHPSKGLVLDYSVMSGTANFTFRGDTTYFVNNDVLFTGNTVIEPGTVVKYNRNTSLHLNGTVDCQAEAYLPAVFTAYDDNSVGDEITEDTVLGVPGSIGVPDGYYAANALWLETDCSLKHLRIRHAARAIYAPSASINLDHSQIGNCTEAFKVENANLNLRNVLIYTVGSVFTGTRFHVDAQHATISSVGLLTDDWDYQYLIDCGVSRASSTVSFLNSLVANCTDQGNVDLTTDHTEFVSENSVFNSWEGIGNYYLPAESPYRNAGTEANLAAGLLDTIRTLTTDPPTYLIDSIEADQTLGLYAARDTDTPDLGYHYDPLDYVAWDLVVNNATLTLAPGVCLAPMGNGIRLQNNSHLICAGTPMQRNHIVRKSAVLDAAGDSDQEAPVVAMPYENDIPTAIFRYTDFAATHNSGWHLNTTGDNHFASLEVSHCLFKGGKVCFSGASSSEQVTLFNNVFDRVNVEYRDSATITAHNNLFKQGSLYLNQAANGSGTWTLQDNAFSATLVTNVSFVTATLGYNAYLNGAAHIPSSQTPTTDKEVASFTFETGKLGAYYQPSENNVLLNAGSQSDVTSIGLAHHTVLASSAKDTGTVDIGFHDVARDEYGNPLDTDADGLPDAIEDANGNGLQDTGETSLTDDDSDDDGYSDGAEVLAGTDPLDGSSHPNSGPCVSAPSNLVGWWRAEGNANDTVTGNPATLLNGASYGAGQVGQAFTFPTANAAVKVNASAQTIVGQGDGESFTLEAWVKITSFSHRNPIFEWNNGQGNWGVHLMLLGAGELGMNPPALYADMVDAQGNAHTMHSGAGVVPLNTYTHIALTFVKGTGATTLYCNGVAVGTANLGGFIPQTSYDLYFGARPSGDATYSLAGAMDEISLYNRALTAAEIAAVHASGNGGKCLPNTAPVAVADSYDTDEDVPLTVNAPGVLANDTDAENNTLAAVPFTGTTAQNGTVTLNADGSFTYSPAENFNGSDTFTYQANDGTTDSASATVTLTVNPIADSPVVSPIPSQSSEEDVIISPINIQITDVDTSSMDLTLSASSSNDELFPAGNIVINNSESSHVLTLVPNADSYGSADITVNVSDGNSMVPRTFRVDVESAPDTPVYDLKVPSSSADYTFGDATYLCPLADVIDKDFAKFMLYNDSGAGLYEWQYFNSGSIIVSYNTETGGSYPEDHILSNPGMVARGDGVIHSDGTKYGFVDGNGCIWASGEFREGVNGDTYVFNFYTCATPDQVQKVLRSIYYTNSSSCITPGERSINISWEFVADPGYFDQGVWYPMYGAHNILSGGATFNLNVQRQAKPIINSQPGNQTVAINGPVTFSVGATGIGVFKYQWKKDGANLVNGGTISGATTDTLNIINVQASDAGAYSVILTTECTSETSDSALLTVQTVLPTLSMPASLTVNANAGEQTVALTDIAAGSGQAQNLTLTVTSSDTLRIPTPTISYTSPNNSGSLQFTPAISTPSDGVAIITVRVDDGVSYVEKQMAVTVLSCPPIITVSPSEQNGTMGGSAVFSATASGTTPLSFQWYKAGMALVNVAGHVSGATSSSLTVSSVTCGDGGRYTVVVTDPNGLSASSSALLYLATKRRFPNASDYWLQTSGRERDPGIGDWYSTKYNGSNNNKDPLPHQFNIDVTQEMIDAGHGSVGITFKDAESKISPDEVFDISDPTRFGIHKLTGSEYTEPTPVVIYGARSYILDGTPVSFQVTTPGTYQVTSETGAYLIDGTNAIDFNNDDNTFCIEVSDCTALISQVQGTMVSLTPSSSTYSLYFLVPPGSGNLTLKNFDMDATGTIIYRRPNNTTQNGTVSGNASWNNGTLNTGGDPIVDVISSYPFTDVGIWTIEIQGLNNNNQFIVEANSGSTRYALYDSRPTSAGNFSIASDSDITTTVGVPVDHKFTVRNLFAVADVITLSLSGDGTILNSSKQTLNPQNTGILQPNESKTFYLRVTPGSGSGRVVRSVISGTSLLGSKVNPANNTVRSITATTRIKVDTAPVLNHIDNQVIPECAAWNLTVSASVPGDTTQTITYSFLNQIPAGMTINSTTGTISWEPTENQNGDYDVTVKATAANTLSATQTFKVQVTDVNVAPVINPNAVLTIDEEVSFTTVGNLATDADRPAQSLSYKLIPPVPEGMTIETSTGRITWKPTEAQGQNSSYSVTMEVSDNFLTATQNILWTVREVNKAPVLDSIRNQVINELTPLLVQAQAHDDDIPANSLTFSFEGTCPTGMSINSATGVINWAPDASQIPGTYTVNVRVTDNGSPALYAVQTFTVEFQTLPLAAKAGLDKTLFLPTALTLPLKSVSAEGGKTPYTVAWEVISGPSTDVTIESEHTSGSDIVPPTAILTLPGLYVVELTVTDSLGTTAKDTIMVYAKANTPPQVEAGPDRLVAPGDTARLSGHVTDDGVPTQSLTYLWECTSQPSEATVALVNGNQASATVTLATAGTYTFRLTVTDVLAASAADTMTVTVKDRRSRTFTRNVDFEQGSLLNVNDQDALDQLQLNSKITPYPFVNVACSARGTVARIDANTGAILGEYRTAPTDITSFPSPSRTTVDKYGNVWVANREDNMASSKTTGGDFPVSGNSDFSFSVGSLTRIGVVLGGTRVNALRQPDPQGKYLMPPFRYNTCVDRNGDGLIYTSRGLGDVFDWTANINSDEEDEAIINYVRVFGKGLRTIAVDAQNNILVGGKEACDNLIQKVFDVPGIFIYENSYAAAEAKIMENETATTPWVSSWFYDTRPDPNNPLSVGFPNYGGLIDPSGALWSAGKDTGVLRLRLDRDNPLYEPTQADDARFTVSGAYGIGIDPATGHVWVSGGGNVTELMYDGGSIQQMGIYRHGGSAPKGVCVDQAGNVWVAHDTTTVGHLRTDGTFVGNIVMPCTKYGNYTPMTTGVAVDCNGNIWVTDNKTDKCYRIDPNGGPVGGGGYRVGKVDMVINLNTGPNEPPADLYNYSDMTGYVSLGAASPSGSWTVVHDGGEDSIPWNKIVWTRETPVNSGTVKVHVRAANVQTDLAKLSFVEIKSPDVSNDGHGLYTGNLTSISGRFIEIRVTLYQSDVAPKVSPVLKDLTVVPVGAAVVISKNASSLVVDDNFSAAGNEVDVVMDVLANDLPSTSDSVRLDGFTSPEWGSVSLDTVRNVLRYTPNRGFYGLDHFTYRITDDAGTYEYGMVNVQVSQVVPNIDPPLAKDDVTNAYGSSSGQSMGVLVDVLANDMLVFPRRVQYANNIPEDSDQDGLADDWEWWVIFVARHRGVKTSANLDYDGLEDVVANVATLAAYNNNSLPFASTDANNNKVPDDIEYVLGTISAGDDDTDGLNNTFEAWMSYAEATWTTPAYNIRIFEPGGDCDADGTINIDEQSAGTSPVSDADANGNHIPDYLEKTVLLDTDMDGLHDDYERWILFKARNDDNPDNDAIDSLDAVNPTDDFDGDGVNNLEELEEELSILAFSQPQHGLVQAVGCPSQIRYIPATGFEGQDTFTYTVGNKAGGMATATVRVNVRLPDNLGAPCGRKCQPTIDPTSDLTIPSHDVEGISTYTDVYEFTKEVGQVMNITLRLLTPTSGVTPVLMVRHSFSRDRVERGGRVDPNDARAVRVELPAEEDGSFTLEVSTGENVAASFFLVFQCSSVELAAGMDGWKRNDPIGGKLGVDYGTMPCGTTPVSKNLWVTNNGTSTLKIELSMADIDALYAQPNFVLPTPTNPDNTFSIPPGGFISVPVRFVPPACNAQTSETHEEILCIAVEGEPDFGMGIPLHGLVKQTPFVSITSPETQTYIRTQPIAFSARVYLGGQAPTGITFLLSKNEGSAESFNFNDLLVGDSDVDGVYLCTGTIPANTFSADDTTFTHTLTMTVPIDSDPLNDLVTSVNFYTPAADEVTVKPPFPDIAVKLKDPQNPNDTQKPVHLETTVSARVGGTLDHVYFCKYMPDPLDPNVKIVTTDCTIARWDGYHWVADWFPSSTGLVEFKAKVETTYNDSTGTHTETSVSTDTIPVYVYPATMGVSLTVSPANELFVGPANFTLQSDVTLISGAQLNSVSFWEQGVSSALATITGASPDNHFTHNMTEVKAGQHTYYVYAQVTWNTQTFTMTARLEVPVSDVVVQANTPPVAGNETVSIGRMNAIGVLIDVLANDQDADGDTIRLVTFNEYGLHGRITQETVGNKPQLRYTPYGQSHGTDGFTYTIEDSKRAQVKGLVVVKVLPVKPPGVTLTSDDADGRLPANINSLELTATLEPEAGRPVAKLEFFDGETKLGEMVDPKLNADGQVTYTWDLIAPGQYFLYAKATDAQGFEGYSEGLAITKLPKENNQAPLVRISNLDYTPAPTDGTRPPPDPSAQQLMPVIDQSQFPLMGAVCDADINDSVSYQINLLRADGTRIACLVENTTRRVGTSQTDAEIATLNLGQYANGIYDLELRATDTYETVSVFQRFVLRNPLQVGRFTFSQEDLTVPVNGLPLSIVRTYDSFNHTVGDFGYGWTYSMSDINLELNEDRMEVGDALSDDPFTLRVGGGRDVTLTLPDGRRTTFTYRLKKADPFGLQWNAVWDPEPGVTATLTTLSPGTTGNDAWPGDNSIFGIPWPHWYKGGYNVPLECYDFPGFKLILEDGTTYVIEREDLGEHDYEFENGDYINPHAYGKARLAGITLPDGSRTEINDLRVDHFPLNASEPTASLVLKRDERHRITHVYAPDSLDARGEPTGPAAVEYTYDANGNLKYVANLVDRNAKKYDVTTFLYDTTFTHYIEKILDPRGIQVARTEYYPNEHVNAGKIWTITDVKGNVTTFDYTPTPGTDGNGVEITDAPNGFAAGFSVFTQTTTFKPAVLGGGTAPQLVSINKADAAGNVIYTKNPDGFETWSRYEQFNPGNASDPQGKAWLLKQQCYQVADPANPSSPKTVYYRDWAYGESLPFMGNPTAAQKLAATSVTETYAAGTPASQRRVTSTSYNAQGQPLGTWNPLQRQALEDYLDDVRTIPDGYLRNDTIFNGTEYDVFGNATKQYFHENDTREYLSGSVYHDDGNDQGQLHYSWDSQGVHTVYAYYHGETGGRPGDLMSVTLREGSPTGPLISKTEYTYDLLGNQLTSTSGSLTTTSVYDAKGRVTQTTDPSRPTDPPGATSETTYNALGKTASTTDRFNATNRFFYDRAGELTRTEYPDNTVSCQTTYYDNKGYRYSVVEDRHTAVATSVTGTRTVSDLAGRTIRSERVKNLVLKITWYGDVCDTAFQGCQVLTSSLTQYYDDGRVYRTAPDLSLDGEFSTVANPANNILADPITRYEYSGDGLTKTTYLPDVTEGADITHTKVVTISDLDGKQVSSQTISWGGVTQSGPLMGNLYDNRGRLTHTLADGVTMSETRYDTVGRARIEIDADGHATALINNGAGQLAWVVTDVIPAAVDLNHSSISTPASWSSGWRGADSTLTEYRYNDLGQQTQQIDGRENITTFEYDSLGRRSKRILPDNTPDNKSEETWAYDHAETGDTPATGKRSNKVLHTDFKNQQKVMVYDINGRLRQKKTGSVVLEEYDYTVNGQRARMRDNPSGGTWRETRYIYDDLGRLRIKHTPEGTLTYGFNAAGNLSSISAQVAYAYFASPTLPPADYATVAASTKTEDPTRALMTYTYDARNRLDQVNPKPSGPYPYDAHYAYDGVGNQARVNYGNGVETAYTYNARNQLTLMASTGSGAVASFQYHDAAWPTARQLSVSGQRRGLVETIAGSTRWVGYTYDNLNRLTKESLHSGNWLSETGAAQYDGAAGYDDAGYDRVGNRQQRTITGTFPTLPNATYAAYDANDRWNGLDGTKTTATFDANGNTLQYNLDGNGSWDQTVSDVYDLENRLIQATRTTGTQTKTITMMYDGDGHRVKKTVRAVGSDSSVTETATTYLVDDRNLTGYAQVLEEWVSLNSQPSTLNCSYTYGLDLISVTQPSTLNSQLSTSYYGYDGHGSVRYLTDSVGVVTDTYDYDAFGILIAQTAVSQLSTLNPYLYTGEQWDSDLGMYYLRARYYSPQIGRFWSMDTYEGSQQDPLSLHKYLYCHDNPVNGVDPSGQYFTISTLVNMGMQFALQTLNAGRGSGAIIMAKAVPMIAGGTAFFVNYGPRAMQYIVSLGSRAPQIIQTAYLRSGGVITRAQAMQTQTWNSFNQLKNALNPIVNNGSKCNPANTEWHHIIERTLNEAKFGAQSINSIANIIPTPKDIHQAISSISQSCPQWIGSMGFQRVRDYVSSLSWEEQYRIGLEIWRHAMNSGGNVCQETIKRIILGI